jgi:uncharacterized membrane protein YphA (DoxX/SURF4 family)
MSTFLRNADRIDAALTSWMARNGIRLLRISLGVVFLWFGVLKFFPGLSPAQTLAGDTIAVLSFGLLTPGPAVFILAVWECLIGVGLIGGYFLRATLLLLWLQMLGTITPLLLFPGHCFTVVPIAPTLEGQYIIKNMVLVTAGLVIGATVRGGRIKADPPDASGLRAHPPGGTISRHNSRTG